MPLIRIDVVKGRSEAEIKALLRAVHQAALRALGVPLRDRYQIVTEHPRSHMVIEDTGLGIERSDRLVVVQVITRRRKTVGLKPLGGIVSEGGLAG
jgi:phenylpyruvate tautomerase PptA (4-oxalocrotonate tautomerase family)